LPQVPAGAKTRHPKRIDTSPVTENAGAPRSFGLEAEFALFELIDDLPAGVAAQHRRPAASLSRSGTFWNRLPYGRDQPHQAR
jgi:hypothetical protein